MIEHQSRAQTVDLVDTAEAMIEAAVAVTTGRLGLDAPWQARARLLAGDEAATGYFRHELARQVGSALMMMDSQVLAVYEEQDTPEAEEMLIDAPRLPDPLRLIVHVEIETAASAALVRAIGDALAHALRDALPYTPRELISARFVTDRGSRWLRAAVNGHRPPPVLVAERPAGGVFSSGR